MFAGGVRLRFSWLFSFLVGVAKSNEIALELLFYSGAILFPNCYFYKSNGYLGDTAWFRP